MSRLKEPGKIDALYRAALSLVMKNGLTGLKMADVAKLAGMATGTIYIYFENKEVLVNQLYTKLKKMELAYLLKDDKPDEGFFVRFKIIWTNYLMFNYTHPEMMIFFEQTYRSPILQEESIKTSDEFSQVLGGILETARQQHIIVDCGVKVIFAQLMGAVHELVKYHIDQNITLTEAHQAQYFEMAWGSIRR
jgi:AcrR family transcriptional regulator